MSTTDAPFTYCTTPAEAPVLDAAPLNLSEEDLTIIRSLVAEGEIAVRAAHAYDRKGYFSTDDFAGARASSYRGPADDIVVQVSVIVPRHEPHRRNYEALTGIHERVQAARQEALVAARQAEVAQAEADLAAAQARLDSLRG